jgi:hypothetical protein
VHVLITYLHQTRSALVQKLENDNLASQTLRMGDTLYALGLDYDNHDFLARLTYPSGRSIDYLPDALGRPTKAAPYVSAVAYPVESPPWSLKRPFMGLSRCSSPLRALGTAYPSGSWLRISGARTLALWIGG